MSDIAELPGTDVNRLQPCTSGEMCNTLLLQQQQRSYLPSCREVCPAFCSAGYTMSAGIACNKLLAKVAAGLHKPDQQTIVPPRCCS